MKRKTKQVWRKDAIIKIQTLLDVTESPKGCFSNKEKLINVSIEKYGIKTSCSFEYTKKGKLEVLKLIQDECYL
jgi:hypothetical protein